MMRKLYLTLFFSLAGLLCFSTVTHAETLEYQTIADAYKASYQYEKVQNYTDAIRTLQVIRFHYPDGYTVNLRLGYLYNKLGKYSNALSHYQTAHQKLPHAISPMLGKMTVRLAQQQYEEVEKIGFTILKADYYNYYGNLMLSQALINLKKYDTAQEVIQRMLNLYPENVTFLSLLAHTKTLQNKISEASQLYSSILILDPENVFAKTYFSMTQKKDKDEP